MSVDAEIAAGLRRRRASSASKLELTKIASQEARSARGATVQPPAWSSVSLGDWDGGLGVGVGATWWGSEVGGCAGGGGAADAGGEGGELGVGGAAEGAEVDAAAVGGGLFADVVGGVALVGRALRAGEVEVAGGEVGEADDGREVAGAGGGAGVVLLVGEEVVVAAGQGGGRVAGDGDAVVREQAVLDARGADGAHGGAVAGERRVDDVGVATGAHRDALDAAVADDDVGQADAGGAVGDLDAGAGAGDGDAVEAGALAGGRPLRSKLTPTPSLVASSVVRPAPAPRIETPAPTRRVSVSV